MTNDELLRQMRAYSDYMREDHRLFLARLRRPSVRLKRAWRALMGKP